MNAFMIFLLLIAAGAGITNSIMSNAAAKKMNAENKQLQQENREDTQTFSREAVLQSNRDYMQIYNEPAKFEQLKNAGLNASMIYGSGFGGTSQSAPMAQTPVVNSPTMMPEYSSAWYDSLMKGIQTAGSLAEEKSNIEVNDQEIENMKAQIPAIEQSINESRARVENILADTGLKNEQIETEDLKQLQQSYLNEQERLNMEWANATWQERVEMVSQQLRNLEAQEKEIYETIKGLEIDNKYKPGLYNAQIAQLNAQAAKLYAERGLILEQQALTQAQTKRTNAENIKLQNESEILRQDIARKQWENENYWEVKLTQGSGVVGSTLSALWIFCQNLVETPTKTFTGKGYHPTAN